MNCSIRYVHFVHSRVFAGQVCHSCQIQRPSVVHRLPAALALACLLARELAFPTMLSLGSSPPIWKLYPFSLLSFSSLGGFDVQGFSSPLFDRIRKGISARLTRRSRPARSLGDERFSLKRISRLLRSSAEELRFCPHDCSPISVRARRVSHEL